MIFTTLPTECGSEIIMNWLSPIVVAMIGGPLMYFLRRLDRNNTSQHGQNIEVLKEIKETIKEIKQDVVDTRVDVRVIQHDVKGIDKRLERHIDWHMDRESV